MVDKIVPNDSRVQYKTANLNGHTYNYILSEPKGTKPLNTIFLIHGFPDMSFGWRYQIPHLTSLGLRVVVPDMIGYGDTDAPEDPKEYTCKKTCDDLAALASHIGVSSIILGGHDWGGAVVYRMAMYYPKLLSAVFSVCTPFMPPQKKFMHMSEMPNFKYQIQLRGPGVVKKIVGEEKIRQFLAGIYGARSKDGKPTFTVEVGCLFDRLDGVGSSPLVSDEELDFYVSKFKRNGMRGPTNWYRTGELNYEDEKEIALSGKEIKFQMPFLFISATNDVALPPSLSREMERSFRSLTKGQVEATHWALWEKPEEINQYLEEFLVGQIGARRASL
ncbi:alpha/beta-hydrolase [Mollisia scopiformis]|uniref:Alpha/beta-hydrolase n=1 Tax=Mollisia scopiformis TaxID=149040 RepID=A0A194XGF3_MOLSC|nr:alpha/beta-hydrolase [Mollisia scopiformis]KUJ19275.1 alpha/beta-hydrolase [Mollisia scopiformis]